MNRLPIPSYLKEYSDDLTLRRIEANKKRYEGTNKQRTGTKKSLLLGEVPREYYTEYLGILGELLVRYYYEITPEYSRYTVSTLLKQTKDVTDDPDIHVVKNGETQKISIKTCENTFKANKYAIDKEVSDIVVFILFTSPEDYLVGDFTPAEVRGWDLRYAYSPYYELKP
tara:strand:- start:839 stop:1348 length:510 start_codon:yes stop_codon:yes gene_type:complete